MKVCVLRNKQTGECTYSRDDIVKYMMLAHRELDKYNPNRQSKKRSLSEDFTETVEGSDLSYRTGLINETTRSIANLVREEEQEQNIDEVNNKKIITMTLITIVDTNF